MMRDAWREAKGSLLAAIAHHASRLPSLSCHTLSANALGSQVNGSLQPGTTAIYLPPPVTHIGQRRLGILPRIARHTGLCLSQPCICQRLSSKHGRQHRACTEGVRQRSGSGSINCSRGPASKGSVGGRTCIRSACTLVKGLYCAAQHNREDPSMAHHGWAQS